jgi:hypothetical protein
MSSTFPWSEGILEGPCVRARLGLLPIISTVFHPMNYHVRKANVEPVVHHTGGDELLGGASHPFPALALKEKEEGER